MPRLFIYLTLLFSAYSAIGQTAKTYTGTYEYDNKSGTATYSYISKNGEEIKQGPFSFKSKLGINGSFSTTGMYDNDLKTGNWKNTSSWSIYNDEEHTKSDFIFTRVTEFRPFVEITKTQTIPFLKGQLTGKEILVFTKKESWGASGGGQKIIVYKKEKTWKNSIIQDFSFETTENNVKKEFLKGKYAVQGDFLVYDSEWTGMVDGKAFKIIYDKGILKSVLIKNQSTGQIIKQENYEVDEELISKYNDKNNLAVTYNNDNAKLIITKQNEAQYEFEVISSNISSVLPDDQIRPLVSYIKYVEKANPYDNQYDDNEWLAGISSLKKKYLSNNRKKGEFWSIRAYNENANKIFETMDEGSIDYIGNGKDFFTQNQDYILTKTWANETPSYFNQSLYIKHLLYKGKADKVLDLFKQAEKSKVFDDENYSGWSLNSVGTMPFYFISLCLAGNLNDATKVIQNNLTNSITYNDGSTTSWIESVSGDIEQYLPFIQKSYPQDRISFLQNISHRSNDIKNSNANSYFDNLQTVKIGQLNWMATYLSPERIDINPSAIIDCHDLYGNKFEKSLIILNYLAQSDPKKFERQGWRLPTLKELKDLFARNLSDYSIKIIAVSPMYGDELVYDNNYKEHRYIGKDDKGILVVYNATKDVVLYPSVNDKNKVSGLCMLIKTE